MGRQLALRAKAVVETQLLRVFYDYDVSESPREWDNLGTMVCWHRNYSLGDDHDYKTPREFMESLAGEIVAKRPELIQDRVDEHFKGYEVKYFDGDNTCEAGWAIFNGDGDIVDAGWYSALCGYKTEEEALQDLKDIKDRFIEEWTEEAENSELQDLAERQNLILPLYLYDHSGITMNTTGFSCSWDSGQVGWIYVSHASIMDEYKEVNEETLERARKLLVSEVKVYDQFLTGDVYGFKLYDIDVEALNEHLSENGLSREDLSDDDWEEFITEVDSCWGFYGDDWKNNGIAECVGDKTLIEALG